VLKELTGYLKKADGDVAKGNHISLEILATLLEVRDILLEEDVVICEYGKEITRPKSS
jgi:hypothetical protein